MTFSSLHPSATRGARQGRGRRRPRSGTATVEFAIVLLLFFSTFLYGMFEVSRAIQVLQVLTNAARAGCRQGIISGNGNSDIKTAVDNVMTANNLPSYQPVTIAVSDPNNSSNTTDAGSASSGSEISVTVSIKASQFAWLGTYIYFNTATQGGTDTLVSSQTLTMRKQ